MDPGPTGETQFGARERGRRTRFVVLARAAISIVMLGGLLFLLWHNFGFRDFPSYRNVFAVLLFYSCVAYFVHPEPDHSNMGWLGGLMDHPFRFSDDVNRFLLALSILLAPGRFWSESLVDLFRLVRHAKRQPPARSE
ncbi:MAG: hypothetical protein JNG86_19425 [Verrucomicrobiaceae bacterium]|nr:hypothetical protein [Verrucomicrobiaceae bacterium]